MINNGFHVKLMDMVQLLEHDWCYERIQGGMFIFLP